MNNRIDKLTREKRAFEQLSKLAKQLHRLDEADCNYGLTERQEKRSVRLFEEADKIAQEVFGLRAYHQADPRGGTLYLVPKIKGANVNYYRGVFVA